MDENSQIANFKSTGKVRYKRLADFVGSWQLAAMKLRLKELRRERGLTGEVLAARAGCSKSYVSEIETGKKFPSGRMLRNFAKVLDVSIYELIDSTDLPDDIVTHIAIMRDLSPDDRRAVARHAAGLLEKDVEP